MSEKRAEEKSSLGVIIDSSMEAFEEAMKIYNRGTLISIKDSLSLCYKDLDMRVKLISAKKELSEEEKKTALEGLFAEMFKIEEKVTYLTKTIEDLKIVDFDTKS